MSIGLQQIRTGLLCHAASVLSSDATQKKRELNMRTSSDSTDRGPVDYVLFGLAFIGFLLGSGGVILSLPAAAIFGLFLMLVSIGALGARS